jgi:hypothetical protein
MQKFELPSLEEVDQLEQRLKGKTIDEIISLLGLPTGRVVGLGSLARRQEP